MLQSMLEEINDNRNKIYNKMNIEDLVKFYKKVSILFIYIKSILYIILHFLFTIRINILFFHFYIMCKPINNGNKPHCFIYTVYGIVWEKLIFQTNELNMTYCFCIWLYMNESLI